MLIDAWRAAADYLHTKFGHLLEDRDHVEHLKGGLLMAVLVIFMFLPQWCCFPKKAPVKNNRRLVHDSGAVPKDKKKKHIKVAAEKED
eukprot:SAG22_NODE_1702_length_3777_cov_30.547308_4_plen_88_part_00